MLSFLYALAQVDYDAAVFLHVYTPLTLMQQAMEI